MKIADIEFEDEAFKECALATGCENAEEVTKLICRKKGITSLQGIEHFTNLKLLDVTRNSLEKLDVSNNLLLEELFAGNNELQYLDVSKNANLTHLEVFINELSELDVSNNAMLEELYAYKNELSKIDLSKNQNLVDLRLGSNDLEDINLSRNRLLEKVALEKNSFDEDVLVSIKDQFQDKELTL